MSYSGRVHKVVVQNEKRVQEGGFSNVQITVLMSTYNGEKYLREQLDSIISQRLPDGLDLKISVRDDGSKDSTIKILEEYVEKSGGILSYSVGENLGPERSFYQLVRDNVDADYYAFSDQDDVWFEDKLARGITAIEAENAKDLPITYSSNATVVDDKLKPLGVIRDIAPLTDLAHVLIYTVSTGCTVVFNAAARREFVKNDTNAIVLNMHDRLLDLLTALFGKIIFDPKPSMYYRQHGNNVCGEQSVGRFRSFFKRAKRFLESKDCSRSENCKMLLRLYGDRLTEEQKRLLYIVGNYKTDKVARKELMKSKVFSKDKRSDYWFRWAVRFKRI